MTVPAQRPAAGARRHWTPMAMLPGAPPGEGRAVGGAGGAGGGAVWRRGWGCAPRCTHSGPHAPERVRRGLRRRHRAPASWAPPALPAWGLLPKPESQMTGCRPGSPPAGSLLCKRWMAASQLCSAGPHRPSESMAPPPGVTPGADRVVGGAEWGPTRPGGEGGGSQRTHSRSHVPCRAPRHSCRRWASPWRTEARAPLPAWRPTSGRRSVPEGWWGCCCCLIA